MAIVIILMCLVRNLNIIMGNSIWIEFNSNLINLIKKCINNTR